MSKQLTIKEERRKKRKDKPVKDCQEENIDVTQTPGYLSSACRYCSGSTSRIPKR
jgi:hypothetical protein